jgi:hypothetical protein
MTWDAVLVARRGLGMDEQRLAAPAFAEAVRWALFAERLSPQLAELRVVAATDPPAQLAGQDRMNFIENRKRARELLTQTEQTLYPPDEDGDG